MISSQTSGAIGGAAQVATIGSAFGPWGTGIGAVLGGVAGSLFGGGEDEAKRLARLQARNIKLTSRENLRRMRREMTFGVGQSRAAIGGSNIQFSGSANRYLKEYETESLRQMGFESQRARMEAEAATYGGELAADNIQRSGIASMLTGLGSAANAGVFGTYSKSTGYQPPWSL